MALRLRGATSGYIELKAPASAGDNTLTLPTNNGSANQLLKTDGSGNLSWTDDNSGVSLSGSTNNTIATVTGANALIGEANLTFDGTTLLNNSDTAALTLRDSSAYAVYTGPQISFQGKDSNQATKAFGSIKGLSISADNGQLRFQTRTNGTLYDRMTIDQNGDVGIGTTSPGTLTWRTGNTLDVYAGDGNAAGQLYLGANRGDGVQTVGSIIFYDNTQTASHQNIAIIEVDKIGSGTNTRGGDFLFYNKVDNGTSAPVTFKIRSGGNCEIPDGNLTFASGHGIDFSATGDGPDSSSELLDDYEEGLYTPTITTTGGSITVNSSYDKLSYTKIGNLVTVVGQIVCDISSPTGNADLSLPFTSADYNELAARAYSVNLAYFNGTGVPDGNGDYAISVRITENDTTGRLQGIKPNYDGSIANWFGAGSDLWVQFSYIAA